MNSKILFPSIYQNKSQFPLENPISVQLELEDKVISINFQTLEELESKVTEVNNGNFGKKMDIQRLGKSFYQI